MALPFLSIVVPAYNEAARLPGTLEKLRQFMASKPYTVEVIVVDDGSRDATMAVAEKILASFPLARVLANETNRGKGFTVRRGVLDAQGQYVLFADADLSTPIEEVDKLVQALENTGAAAAIGSRALQRELIGVHQPWPREFAGRFFNVLVRLITGLKMHDTQCGFKLFRRGPTDRAFHAVHVEGFGFDPELLFLIQRSGGKIVEVPVRWNNSPDTKVRFWRDSLQMFFDLFLLRWRMFTGSYRL